MAREDTFLQAIREEPDADRPRLVFADWLTEHGDPRGEFIRFQCALARIDGNDPGRKELRRRERELLDQHADSWLGVPPQGLRLLHSVGFDRGLLRAVVFPEELAEDPVSPWWAAHRNWVSELCLAYVQDESFLQVVARDLLSQVTVLELSCDVDFTDDGLELLAELIQLRKLSLFASDMGGVSYTDAGLIHLAGLMHLRKLEIESRNAITDAGLEHLATLTQLQELRLWGAEIASTGQAKLRSELPGCKIDF
jgi:uncharacterized protein (TIGR02996 family)